MSGLYRSVIALVCVVFVPPGFARDSIDIKQFAEAFTAAETAAWERGDFSALEKLEHADVAFQNINGTVYRGFEAHKQAILDTKARFNGAPVTQQWRYLMGEGNIFTVSYKWTFHTPQRDVDMMGIAVGRLQDGKLIEEWGAGSIAAGPPRQ